MSNETIAWKICYTENGQYCTALSEHNSVGDYRAIDPMASSIALCAAPVSSEPVAWVRRHPDGALTSAFLEHAVIDPVRKDSGAWVPLYTAPVAAQAQLGEDIIVNCPDNVYTLPLQSSGLTQGPGFVVHVPAQTSASAELECSHCGGTGDVSGEYPGVACPACGGTGKAAPVAAQAHPSGIHPFEITDGMALVFHNAIADGSIGQQEVNEIKTGLRAVFANIEDSRPLADTGLTQQTLDDVKAGIPARDAEIEALRREIETVQAQHAATLANIEAFVACDASAVSYLSLGEYRTALLRMLRQAPAKKEPGA